VFRASGATVEAVTDMLVCSAGLAYIGTKFSVFIGTWIVARRCSICQTILCAPPNGGGMIAIDELVTAEGRCWRSDSLPQRFPTGIRENCKKHVGCPVHSFRLRPK
jgi:hypothetical protein